MTLVLIVRLDQICVYEIAELCLGACFELFSFLVVHLSKLFVISHGWVDE